jgi:hypothetical protein
MYQQFVSSWVTRHSGRPRSKNDVRTSCRIAVLDTGIDFTATSKVVSRNAISGVKDFTSVSGDAQDRHGHGTDLISLLARLTVNSQIFVAKISNGSFDDNTWETVARVFWLRYRSVQKFSMLTDTGNPLRR